MKKVLHSRISGRTISITTYRVISHLFVGIPLLLMTYGAIFIEKDLFARFLTMSMILFSLAVCVLASNRLFFGFDGTALLIMNGMGYVRKRVNLNEVTFLAIVGAAFDYPGPGGNKLGYRDETGRFIYYPYLLLYKSRVDIRREGDDVRSYGGQEYGFIIFQANIRLFHAILDGTDCPVYFDERLIQDHYNLYELCQKSGRVKTLH